MAKRSIRSAFFSLAAIGVALAAAQILAMDMASAARIRASDFANFYSAGSLAAHGLFDRIYDPISAPVWSQIPYRTYVSQLFPLEGSPLYETFFAYPPAAALLFAAFSVMPFRLAMVLWQILSVCSLFVAAWCVVSTLKERVPVWRVVFASFALFLTGASIVIAQNVMVIGVLPAAAGFYLAQKRYPIAAGLCWSLLALKPQFLLTAVAAVAPLAIAACLSKSDTRTRTLQLAAAFAVGSATILFLPAVPFGFSTVMAWLHESKLVGVALFAQSETGTHSFNLISLPAAACFTLPPAMRSSAASWITMYFALAYIVVVALSATVAHRLKDAWERQLDVCVLIPIILLPVYSPYLGNVDLAFVLPACWIYIFRMQNINRERLLQFGLGLCLLFNAVYIFLPLLAQMPVMREIVLALSLGYTLLAIGVTKSVVETYSRQPSVETASSVT